MNEKIKEIIDWCQEETDICIEDIKDKSLSDMMKHTVYFMVGRLVYVRTLYMGVKRNEECKKISIC